jgi:excisionase family DNA binding protein
MNAASRKMTIQLLCAPSAIRGSMEPTPGLEPGTYGLRSGRAQNTTEPEESRSVTFREVTDSATSPNVPPRPANPDPFAALVLHGSGRLVSPKEAAERLGIKRSTVYTLCAKGELPHVRVGSLLRIDLDAFLAMHR